MSISPEVCVDYRQATLYVATTDGRLRAISTSDGEPIAEIEVAGMPVAAADGIVIVVDRPDEYSLGSVSFVEQHPSNAAPPLSRLSIRWTAPLLDPKEFEQVRHALADGDLAAEIESSSIGVTGRFRLRYLGGAEPPTGGVAEEFVVTATYDRASGQRSAGTPADAHLTSNDREAAPIELEPQILPVDPVAGEWAVQQPEGASRTVQLDPGTVAAQVVDDRVLYKVVEHPADGSGTRRYLRSRPIDPDQGPGWSHLVEQSLADPPPRRP